MTLAHVTRGPMIVAGSHLLPVDNVAGIDAWGTRERPRVTVFLRHGLWRHAGEPPDYRIELEGASALPLWEARHGA